MIFLPEANGKSPWEQVHPGLTGKEVIRLLKPMPLLTPPPKLPPLPPGFTMGKDGNLYIDFRLAAQHAKKA